MKTHILSLLYAILLVMAGSHWARADAPERLQLAQAEAIPTYVPPLRGAPGRRIGGSSRGFDRSLPEIAVLAPDHVGHTLSPQPVLYWYISKPTRVRLEITLIDETGIAPLLERQFDSIEGPAIHSIDLARHGIFLKPGIEYQWSVTLVPDANERSGDVISGGAIRLTVPPPAVQDRLAVSSASKLSPVLLAAEGFWYDAYHNLSLQIGRQPQDSALHSQRAALAEQIGLRQVAAFDLGQ